MTRVYIGCGAGFAGDRYDGCRPVIRQLSQVDGPRYLIFEVLAERTLAIAQNIRRQNPNEGYSPFLEEYLRPILRECQRHSIRIVTNAGAANPAAAGTLIADWARRDGVANYRIGVVEGDDLRAHLSEDEIPDTMTPPLVSANAYLGAEPIVQALQQDADIVITGRCADPALALGPLRHAFGWQPDQWDLMAAGTLAGHLIECGPQSTGATFVDPGVKDHKTLDAPGLTAQAFANIGFPIAEVDPRGGIVISKPDNTGGLISRATVAEQLLYEIHDPANYLTPDVVLDITEVELKEVGRDRVSVTGARGKPAPAHLKVTVSGDGGWLGEAELSYAGSNALARAKFAIETLRARLDHLGVTTPIRTDIIGLTSILDGDSGALRAEAKGVRDGDYRLRICARAPDKATVAQINREALSLWSVGPAGAAGFRHTETPQVATDSIFVARDRVAPTMRILEV